MFLVAQHSQNEKFCYRVIVATQKLYELLPQEKAQSQQPTSKPEFSRHKDRYFSMVEDLAKNIYAEIF
jgi:hypothetical protein